MEFGYLSILCIPLLVERVKLVSFSLISLVRDFIRSKGLEFIINRFSVFHRNLSCFQLQREREREREYPVTNYP